jgi:NitT/TauT family transport system substrate-binding protein
MKTILAFALAIVSQCSLADEALLRLRIFPGAGNLPLIVGEEQGIFARHGVKLQIDPTPNSDAMRAGLAAGEFDIALGSADNAVAMVESAGKDVIIVAGGDNGLLKFMARDEIKDFGDLRGRVIAVDAPNTAFALVAKKILKSHGLKEGSDYTLRPVGGTQIRAKAMAETPDLAAGILNAPFTITIQSKGFKSLGAVRDLVGQYQSVCAWVMRPWAEKHADQLTRYIAAYIDAVRWAMDPANRALAQGMLAARFKLDEAVAKETMDQLMTPGLGLEPDASLDMDGMRTVLALRAEMEGQWGGKPPAVDKYVDLSYYRRALSQASGK